MKSSDEQEKWVTDMHKKILSALEMDQVMSLFTSVMGMSKLFMEFIMVNHSQDETPIPIKYAILQMHSYVNLVAYVLLGRGNEFINMTHLPTHKGSWEDLEDFEERFKFIVKSYYEQLKKEGKL